MSIKSSTLTQIQKQFQGISNTFTKIKTNVKTVKIQRFFYLNVQMYTWKQEADEKKNLNLIFSCQLQRPNDIE